MHLSSHNDYLDRKRESHRVQIRRNQNNQKFKNMRNSLLKQARTQSFQHQQFSRLFAKYVSTQDVEQQQVISSFSTLVKLIEQPSQNPDSIKYLEILNWYLNQDASRITNQIITYLEQFITKHTYHHIAKFKHFQSQFLWLLEINVSQSNFKVDHLKRLCMDWCQGTKSICVIHNCVTGFLNVRQYSHIYDIILYCLRDQNNKLRLEAAYTLHKLLKDADYDDLYSIYQSYDNIIIQILSKILNTSNENERHIYIEVISQAIATYQSVMFDYAKAGIAFLACHLIASQSQSENNQGLNILGTLSQSQDKAMQEFLTEDHELINGHLWENFLKFQKSTMVDNRILFYQIVSYLVVNANFETVQLFNQLIGNRLLEITCQGFYDDHQTILLHCLYTLQTLLYYSELHIETNSVNIVYQRISQNHLVKRLLQLEEILTDPIIEGELRVVMRYITKYEPE